MPTFQVVVGDPDTGDSYQFDVEDQAANRFVGRELGEEVDGGADTAGRPMREDVAGANLTEVMLAGRSTGYDPDREGERRRVTVRGREITDEIVQVNATIAERGEQSVEELLGEDAPDDDE